MLSCPRCTIAGALFGTFCETGVVVFLKRLAIAPLMRRSLLALLLVSFAATWSAAQEGAGAVSAPSGAASQAGSAAPTAGEKTSTSQPAKPGEFNVVVEIPRSQWCQCVRGLLNVEGGNAGACVKSGVSEEKLKIFKERGSGGERSNSVSFLLSLAGCTETENENVGSLSFNVEWLAHAAGTGSVEPPFVPVSCAAGGIAAVEATFYRSSGEKLASAGPWTCSGPVGTLRHIPAGSGIRMIVTGKSASGDLLFRGERSRITISYAKTTPIGTVQAPSFTPFLLTPANRTLLGTGRMNYTWTRPAGATGYRLQVSAGQDFSSVIEELKPEVASSSSRTTLASGDYFWRVQASDEFGNRGEWSPPSSMTIDTEPPINTTGDGFINKGAKFANGFAVTLAISAEKKRGSGITGYYVAESAKKPDPGKAGWVAIATTPTYTADIPFKLSKRDGAKSVSVWFKDGLGHVSKIKAWPITVDTKLIKTTITSHPSQTTNSTSAQFAFVANKPNATFECRIDEGAYSACTGTAMYEGLADGPRIFTVKATDAAGNQELSPPSYAWIIDTDPPHTVIIDHPQSVTELTAASFSFTSSKPQSTFTCRIDAGQEEACTSPHAYKRLAEALHTFTVRATDSAGNTDPTPPAYAWTVSAPFHTMITQHPPDPSDSTDAVFRFTSRRKDVTYRCQIDGGEFSACVSPRTYEGLSEEVHTFTVKAVDAAGIEDPSPPSYTWNIGLAPPEPVKQAPRLDARIPESPVFTMLDLTEDITPPAGPRELALSLLTGYDVNGNLETAASVDISPYLLFKGGDLTLKQYQESKRLQMLSRIQMSLAVAKAMSDQDKAMRIGTSVRWTIWDDGDLRLDNEYQNCLDAAESSEEQPPAVPANMLSFFAEPMSRTEYCRVQSMRNSWNRSSMDVGFAPSWIEPEGIGLSLKSNGYGLWTTWSYGFDRFESLKHNSQLLLQARYRKNDQIPINSVYALNNVFASTYVNRDSTTLGVKYRWSIDPRFLCFVQLLHEQATTEGIGDTRQYIWSLGSEIELTESFWLSFEMSGQGNPGFLSLQLRYAFPESKAVR
jgi:hypothetical protein